MTLLALEFSSDQRSVALLKTPLGPGDQSAFEVIETGGRATRAFAMIEETLRQANVRRQAVQCLAVGLGPGSYTGIRAALAIAQGWQLANNVKLLGLSSAEGVAAEALAQGVTGRVAVVIDAQRGEFYLAQYDLASRTPRELEPLRLATRVEVERCQAAGATLVGPEVNRWFPNGVPVFPRAAVIARLAENRTGFVPGEMLEPIYLRPTAFVKAPPPRVIP